MPFMQIMGFDCHLLHLVLVQSKQYMVVNVATFSYPATKSQVNEGGIEKLVNVLSYIKSSALSMKAKIDDERTKRHISKIDDFVGTSTVADTEEWETKLIWPDMSVLEDSRDWDDSSEDAEENIRDEEDDEEECEEEEVEEDEKDEEEENESEGDDL